MRSRLAAVAAAGVLLIVGAAGCGDSPEPEQAAPAAPSEFFGIVPQGLLTDEDLARMQEGRVGTIRLVIPWGALVPKAGEPEVNFASIDPIILSSAENSIRIVPTIYGTPTWVAEDLDGFECNPGCGPFAPRSDQALAAWRDFVGQMVDRYGPDGELWRNHPEVEDVPVRSWQIWNEQNSPTFYQPQVDPASYEVLVQAASDAIKERDPEAEVILGGMFGTPMQGKPPAMKAADFLRQLYEIDGAKNAFDSVAAHPYAAHQGKIELQVELLHDEIERAGDDATMWITEIGASSDEGSPLERGPEGQAEMLTAAFEFFLAQRQAWDIQGVTWYSWRDVTDPNACDWCPGSGLFPEESLDEPKPAWEAFVQFTGGS